MHHPIACSKYWPLPRWPVYAYMVIVEQDSPHFLLGPFPLLSLCLSVVSTDVGWWFYSIL
jgi:hypothetical protein